MPYKLRRDCEVSQSESRTKRSSRQMLREKERIPSPRTTEWDRGRNDTEAGTGRSDIHRSWLLCDVEVSLPPPLPPPEYQPPRCRQKLHPHYSISPTFSRLPFRYDAAHQVYTAQRGVVVSFRRRCHNSARDHGRKLEEQERRERRVGEHRRLSVATLTGRDEFTHLPACFACLPACPAFIWASYILT